MVKVQGQEVQDQVNLKVEERKEIVKESDLNGMEES